MAVEDSQFKPGWEGGPGRPALPTDLKESKRMTHIEILTIMYDLLQVSQDGLKEVLKDGTTSVKKALVASIIARAIHDGDEQRFNFILTKIFGPEIHKPLQLPGSVDDVDNPELLKAIPSAVIIKMIKELSGK